MAKLTVSSSRPRLRNNYLPDSPPRYVIAGVEHKGSWRRDQSVTVDVRPGQVHVVAYYLPWHPIGRFAKRKLRRAEVDVDVPVGDATVALEFRPSRLWTQPGKLRRKKSTV